MAAESTSARLSVHVMPRARRDSVDGFRDDVLCVRVSAPPVDGKANEAVVRLLAKSAGIPRSRVNLVRGARGREKLIEFEGIDESTLRNRLGWV